MAIAAGNSSTNNVFSDLAGYASEAINQGKADAIKAAERTVPVVKKIAAQGTYTFFYHFAYAAVFAVAVAVDLLPENGVIRNGIRDGAEAGRQASDHRRASSGTEH